MKKVSSTWARLPDKEKVVYNQMAQKDKIRYEEEFREFSSIKEVPAEKLERKSTQSVRMEIEKAMEEEPMIVENQVQQKSTV